MNHSPLQTGILNAAYDLFFEGKVQSVTLTSIASKANISIDSLQNIYPKLNDVTAALATRSITELRETNQALAQEKGIETLQSLISNDIKFFYRIEIDRLMLTDQSLIGHIDALRLFDEYFNLEMPKIYAIFFENNPHLLPSSGVDPVFYAHFISHSLRFFNLKTLESYEPSSEGRKKTTEHIIAGLFGRDEITLSNF